MSYQILPNIIFLFAVLGILLMILRHLPAAKDLAASDHGAKDARANLSSKGLPTRAVSTFNSWFKVWMKRIWNFALEAKDLKPTSLASYKIRQIFKEKPKSTTPAETPVAAPATTPATQPQQVFVPTQQILQAHPKPKDEKYYLDVIKENPKDLGNYDELGKYYLDNMKFEDARDIYVYLINHQPNNPTYHARLAYAFYRLRQFKRAADHYKRSLSLDSSQPNRYYNLGLTLDAHGDKKGSIEAFEKAIALEPKNIKFYTTLANILIKYAHKDRARDLLAKARTLDPSNSEILEKLNSLK